MIDYSAISPLVWLAIVLALTFDFFNGVNDAANSIATVVATRALPPIGAVAMAAFFNFVGAFIGLEVAATVGSGIIHTDIVDTPLILGTLVGGIGWTALASKMGLPISVSHALIGGLVGAGLMKAGMAAVQWPTAQNVLETLQVMGVGALIGVAVMLLVALGMRARSLGSYVLGGATFGSSAALLAALLTGALKLGKVWGTVLFIFFAPIVSFVMSFLLVLIIMRAFQRFAPARLARWFRWLQLASSSAFSLGHGTNDAQKTMGIIAVLLLANNVPVNGQTGTFAVPWEVIVGAASAIALGTFVGGYRVVRTMGHRLTHLRPYQGFAAEAAGALNLFFLAGRGVPASTTHTIAGAIMGVGATRSVYAVSWGVARNIMGAWILTIPTTAIVSALAYVLVRAALGG